MKIALVLLVASGAGCRDQSGEARAVGSASRADRTASAPAPEPGGSPTCSEVAAALAAQVPVGNDVRAAVPGTQGAEVAVSGDSMHAALTGGIAETCRRDAWSVATRSCVVGWHGDFLREAAALRAACPGMVKP